MDQFTTRPATLGSATSAAAQQVVPFTTVAYAAPGQLARAGRSGFGIGSLAACLATLLVCVFCFFKMSDAHRLDGYAWLAIGFFGNWVGCAVGLALGLAGVLQGRTTRRLAVWGLVCNVLLLVVPAVLAMVWFATAAPAGPAYAYPAP